MGFGGAWKTGASRIPGSYTLYRFYRPESGPDKDSIGQQTLDDICRESAKKKGKQQQVKQLMLPLLRLSKKSLMLISYEQNGHKTEIDFPRWPSPVSLLLLLLLLLQQVFAELSKVLSSP